ncbi:MAG: HAMP domain-containing protein, partial [Deltaproteobacteria bacterium]
MILNRIEFINRMPIRLKVSLTVALILALIIGLLTTYGLKRERDRMIEGVKKEVTDLTTMYFDSLNTMMLTGIMDKRDILRKKMLSREGIVEARAIRGKPVSDQFGPGLPDDVPVDDLDHRALGGEEVHVIARKDGRRVLTVIMPFKATENTRGVNCLKCHNVNSGDVNGAVRISYSLAALDEALDRELWMAVVGNAAFFVAGLFLVNMLLKTWVVNPLNNLMDVVTRRGKGDLKARAASISADDELGKLAMAFNDMSDTTDSAAARDNERTDREHAAAVELGTKVNELLRVVNRVADGDFSARVNFTGEDSIGSLAGQLQNMVDHIRESSEEKHRALEFLQQRVNIILDVVTRAAEGDLTGKVDIKGDDAIAQLGTGIQRMIGNLNALVTQVQRSGIQLASAVNSIAATSKEQEATVAEQAATTNEI